MFIAIGINNVEGGDKLIEKFVESKTRKSFNFQKFTKLGKKLLKNRNSPNFKAKKDELSFLTPKAKIAFNCL